ncbi:1-acyl-sn-glycerol-3-phosphate acyltransferase [termite gut metagenome]|uniref:1-acyl-sn-glycerol-3-phosphate acyltransferase n=1 Tax=termite gut metagenome TaxID=433724 RepID=A0A5J4SRZ2_9ZZZZ
MKRVLILVYQITVWLPLMLIATVSTALITTIGCFCGGEKIFSYYPGMIWSRFTCFITFSPVKVTGREKLDKKQSYIFVANHQGAYDIFLIYGYLGIPIKWIMKQSLRKIPFVGKACEMAGFIFVDNSSPVAAAKTIKEAEKRLKNGASIAIFPEGSRSRNGKLGKFKKGAYQMAMDLKLPIVPVTINGSYEVMSKKSFCIRPHKMELIIHEPITTPDLVPDTMREAAVAIRTLTEQSKSSIESTLWNKYL